MVQSPKLKQTKITPTNTTVLAGGSISFSDIERGGLLRYRNHGDGKGLQ